MARGKFWVNNHAHIIKSNVSNAFVCHYLNQIDYSVLVTGTTRLKLTQNALQRLPLRVAPANEQHRIVAKIEELFSELDKGIESLKTARRQLEVYRQSVLKHAFEGKLTAQWREDNKDKLETPDQLRARIKRERKEHYERQLQKWKQAISAWEEAGQAGKKPRRPVTVERLTEEANARSKGLPANWASFCADSLGVIQLGRQRSPKNRSRDYPTKYIRAANITERGLDLDDVLDMDFRPDEVDAYRLEKADLVLSEASGSPAQVGKPAIWADQIPNCCFQNTVIRHQPHRREHAPYLYWVYRFFYLNGKFAEVAGGVGINHLSASKFGRMVVPLCSLPEQRQVVGLLEQLFSEIEQNEREIITVLEQAEVLRQSILRKAFSGQLVPQDPDDEPASILLEKIRLDREKAVRGAPTARRKRKTTPVE